MTIRDVEQRCGMERANIRFYEREGLISPERRENGYREYTEENVQTLLRIRLLRSLHVGLDEIGALVRGERELDDTLREQLERLEREQQNAAAAGAVCREIRSDRATYQTLDAQRYLDRLEEAMHTPVLSCPPDDRDAAPRCPWRRYFARWLDGMICMAAFSALLAALGVMLTQVLRDGRGILLQLGSFAVQMLTEPLLLHWFGTTPGKAIMGLHMETEDGTRPGIHDGWTRFWEMLWYGEGIGIPFFSLYRLYKSYARSADGEEQPWDEGFVITARKNTWQRWLGLIGAAAGCFFLIVTLVLAQQLPPNRGALTMAQYAENFAYYEKLLDVEFEKELGADGAWHEPQREDGMIVISMHPDAMPEYHFETESGEVVGVWFEVVPEDKTQWVGSYYNQMLLCALSLAGAQKENGIYADVASSLSKRLPDTLQSVSFTANGVNVMCEVETKGYRVVDLWSIPDDSVPETEREFCLCFSVEIAR